MRTLGHAAGVFAVFQGVGGTIDQLGVHVFGALYILKHLPFLHGHEICANVVLAVVGLVVLAAADRAPARKSPR